MYYCNKMLNCSEQYVIIFLEVEITNCKYGIL